MPPSTAFWCVKAMRSEKLAAVTKITFDKTGTLTYGTPKVTEIVSVSSFDKEEIHMLAASVEKLSEHPLGKAIVKAAAHR